MAFGMTIRKMAFMIFLSLTIPSYAISDVTDVSCPDDCIEGLEVPRRKMLEALHRFEEHFIRMKWQYWKYREVVYFPLWEAVMQKENVFSKEKGVAGELLFDRYRHLADVVLSEAETEGLEMHEALQRIEGQIQEMSGICVAWDYQDCLGLWRDQMDLRLSALRKLIENYGVQEKQLATQIEKTLDETPSEHHDFAARYYDKMTHWNYRFYPEFIHRMREIQGKLEWDWLAERCCTGCTAEGVKVAQNPLLGDRERKRVSERRGVGGKTLNKNDLVRAFEEMEERRGTEGSKR